MKRFRLFLRNAVIILALFSFNTCVFGQENPVYQKMPRIVYPSGDAAALGRYGDYPVDKSTGVPSISIPFFEIQLNDFKLPISFSYHASGNKVDDISSVLGLGWALNAGGCISRTVLGNPDENNGHAIPNLYERDYSTREEISNLPTVDDKRCRLNELIHGFDLEADIYSFNFNGYSGQFRHDSNNDLILSTYDDIKITGGPISGFTITTPDGSRYRFLDGDSMTINMATTYKSCWYLNQIITANSDTVDFKYNAISFVQGAEHHPSFSCTVDAGNNHNSVWKFTDYTDVYKLRYIAQITFKSGNISFAYENRDDIRPKRLNEISVYDRRGQVIKKAQLGQSYFLSAGGNPASPDEYKYFHRLKLENVDIVNPNNAADIQRYSFDYNSTSLPPYFHDHGITPTSYYSQDYWGYFNNAYSNVHLMPVVTPCSGAAANRNVNADAMKATILTKVIYPTGGRTEFAYESNSGYGNLLGGLRIVEIKNFDDPQSTVPLTIKSYEYPTGGYPTKWLQYSNIGDLSRWHYINGANSELTNNYSSSPIGNISYNNGLIAVYSKVWEYTGENNELKTEYNYEIISEDQYESFYFRPNIEGHHLYPHYYVDEPYRSGQLLSQIDYKKEGSNYSPVREIENTWTSYHVRDAIVGIKIVPYAPGFNWCSVNGTSPDDVYQYFNIYVQSGVKKLTKTIERLHSSNGVIQKVSDFEYNETHGFVTKEILTTSSGEKSWKINNYLPDVFFSPTGVYQTMKDMNMIGSPLEVISGATINNTDVYLGANVYEYDKFADLPKISRVKQLHLETPSSTYTSWTDSRLRTEMTLESYDTHGNLLSSRPTNNFPTGYQWGYNQSYPVAKVINAKNIFVSSTGYTLGYIPFLSNSTTPITETFTTDAPGQIKVYPTISNTPNGTAKFNIILMGATNFSDVVCISSNSGCNSDSSVAVFPGMPAGTYHLQVSPVINNIIAPVTINYRYMETTVSAGLTEFFYQGFEEFVGATEATPGSPSYAGRYYFTGDYIVSFTAPNSRAYMIEYHYWNGSGWINIKKPFTTAMVLTEGTAIDEVRVYPSDSQMTTYTYDPLVGMTSSSDENNFTIFYEYDDFGRLKFIRDQNRNILKGYEYYYKE